jgi:type IV secretory pathway VirB2 component (pilin)
MMKNRRFFHAWVFLFFLALPASAGTRTGGSSFAWDSFLQNLQSNVVTTIAGFFAVVALVAAAMAHRSGDSEATIKRVLLALFLGGVALGAEVLVDDIAADFGATLPVTEASP